LIQRQQRCAFWSLLSLAFTVGLHNSLVVESNVPAVVVSVATQTYIVLWCIADARSRDLVLIRSWNMPLHFLWPVSVPLYFIWSRGLRGLRALLGMTFLLFGMMTLGSLTAVLVSAVIRNPADLP
jgi:hypothetical protein